MERVDGLIKFETGSVIFGGLSDATPSATLHTACAASRRRGLLSVDLVAEGLAGSRETFSEEVGIEAAEPLLLVDQD